MTTKPKDELEALCIFREIPALVPVTSLENPFFYVFDTRKRSKNKISSHISAKDKPMTQKTIVYIYVYCACEQNFCSR